MLAIHQADIALGARSYADVVAYLTRPANNDVEKVRAFFVWIANHGIQRVMAYEDSTGLPPRDSPLFLLYCILIQRKAGSYNPLFASLCRYE